MQTFVCVLQDEGPTAVRFCSKVTAAEAHTLQTHVVSIRTIVSQLSLLSLMAAPSLIEKVDGAESCNFLADSCKFLIQEITGAQNVIFP